MLKRHTVLSLYGLGAVVLLLSFPVGAEAALDTSISVSDQDDMILCKARKRKRTRRLSRIKKRKLEKNLDEGEPSVQDLA